MARTVEEQSRAAWMDRTKRVPQGRPLRILIVSSLPLDSGSFLRARYIAEALRKAGADVRMLNNIKSLPFLLDFVVSFFLNLRALLFSCDVILGLKPHPNITLVMLVKKLLGTLTVLDVDDIDYGYRGGLLAKANRALQISFPKRFSLVTYHSAKLRPFIENTFQVAGEKLFQLPQGVDLSVFHRRDITTFKQSFLARHGLAGKKIVVYAGHLNVACDLDMILQIIRIAHVRMPTLRLLVIGGGPLERRFRRIAKQLGVDGIAIFTGHVLPEEAAECLQCGDVGIVFYKNAEANYYRESMKLREMLALELKVVCNNVGDLQNFADYTYQVDTDPEAVASELVRVLENGGDGREVRGARFVRNNLAWDHIGRALYVKLIQIATRSGAPRLSSGEGRRTSGSPYYG